MTGPQHVDDDRGCLRMVLAVPFALLALVAAFFCWVAVITHPFGPWDRDAYAGIAASSLLAIGAAGVTLALWVMPSVRRIMAGWWVAPAVLFGVVAGIRWMTSA